MAASQRIVVPAGDPEREYTPEENERITANLLALFDGIHTGLFSSFPVDVALLESLHRNIFHGVRSHAGRVRRADSGSEHLTFGPHRSVHRDEVPGELRRLFESFAPVLAELEENAEQSGYEEAAISAAVKLHADVIRIHPFEDGNGRSTRALLNVVLIRLGLRPLVIEAPKQEYLACLNYYFTTGDLGVLLDFAVGLYLFE